MPEICPVCGEMHRTQEEIERDYAPKVKKGKKRPNEVHL
jgi:hypothetical protein